uniref:Thromboxane A2 receptor n=1 Tax=Acanthochromis polyacanthus TaxID=80966 RepID=A0A3Q1FSA9_9TELE
IFPFFTPACLTSEICVDLKDRNSYTHRGNERPSLNSTSPPLQPSGLWMSCFTMIFGAISNLTALGILAKTRVRFRRHSRAPFFLLTVALLLVDLGGHVVPGAFALYLHVHQRYRMQAMKPTGMFCHIFGASMVFFGLCPLLFGCAMAVERCVAITQPFFHASMISVAHARRVVFFLSALALVLAVLPLFAVGTYTIQFPGTWCFLPIHDPQSAADTNLALAFSSLGLTALTFSLLCNILSGLVLLQTRMKSYSVNAKPGVRRDRRTSSASSSSLFCSLDVEMMTQLAAITVVLCVCWSPLLVSLMSFHRASGPVKDEFLLLGLRMASWNQILDPWVYILLRRTVLFRVCCGVSTRRNTVIANSSCAETRRQAFSLQ